MATAALENFEFPYKHLSESEAARKVFRKITRHIPDELLLDLDEHWFYFKQHISMKDLPKFIIKAMSKPRITNNNIITLAAFAYMNSIDSDVFTGILQYKCENAEEQFNQCLSDFDDPREGDIIRNVTLTYNIPLGYRVNLNNEPMWLVDFGRDKENVPPHDS